MMNIFNANLVSIFLFFVGLIFLVFFLYAAIVSFIEKENRAAYYFIFAEILSLSVILLPLFYEFAFQELYSTIVLSIIILFLAVYIVDIFPTGKIDERNIMFSRIKLEKGTDNYFDFYSRNPDKQLIDDKIRNNTGLLSDNSTNYNHAMFSSVHSSFFAVDAFSSIIDGEVSPKISTFKPEDISNYIKNWTKKLGAVDVGITELKDYHKYSYRGRKNINGVKRRQINQETCFNFWTIFGTDCSKCVSVCPYSYLNNLLHNIVRFGIDNSTLFSKLADTIYGRKPLSKLPASWMKME